MHAQHSWIWDRPYSLQLLSVLWCSVTICLQTFIDDKFSSSIVAGFSKGFQRWWTAVTLSEHHVGLNAPKRVNPYGGLISLKQSKLLMKLEAIRLTEKKLQSLWSMQVGFGGPLSLRQCRPETLYLRSLQHHYLIWPRLRFWERFQHSVDKWCCGWRQDEAGQRTWVMRTT